MNIEWMDIDGNVIKNQCTRICKEDTVIKGRGSEKERTPKVTIAYKNHPKAVFISNVIRVKYITTSDGKRGHYLELDFKYNTVTLSYKNKRAAIKALRITHDIMRNQKQ